VRATPRFYNFVSPGVLLRGAVQCGAGACYKKKEIQHNIHISRWMASGSRTAAEDANTHLYFGYLFGYFL